ncbi:MAG: alpha/beta hydrolase [Clostridia bacterium]|nr:alpha/beta hydrolase [Clostridia bacterium]
MENTIWKRMLACAGLLLFVAVLVLVPVALYADSIYRDVFDAREVKAQNAEAEPTNFDLFAEEGKHQVEARISGWLSAVDSAEVVVSSARGKLYAAQYEPVGSGVGAPWTIVFHGGLGTDRNQVKDVACMLSIRGYRVLTPDLFAHGESEGDASTLGFGDAQDVHAWIDFVRKADPDARIVLYGVDEGACAVLSAACEGLDDAVAAVAADSACDDGAARMRAMAGAGEGSLKGALLDLVFRRKAGGAEPISARISGAKVPLLLIHGTGDQVVPAWNSEDIVSACPENASLLFVEGAGHGQSRFLDEALYYDALFEFYQLALE